MAFSGTAFRQYRPNLTSSYVHSNFPQPTQGLRIRIDSIFCKRTSWQRSRKYSNLRIPRVKNCRMQYKFSRWQGYFSVFYYRIVASPKKCHLNGDNLEVDVEETKRPQPMTANVSVIMIKEWTPVKRLVPSGRRRWHIKKVDDLAIVCRQRELDGVS